MSEIDRIAAQFGFETDDHLRESMLEVKRIDAFCQTLLTTAYREMDGDNFEDPVWDKVYHYVFSDKVSKRIWALEITLNRRMEYYDPDTTYHEDSVAFIRALHEFAEPYRDMKEG